MPCSTHTVYDGSKNVSMGEMLHYSLYCPNCDCWTLQHVWESGHERDVSQDWKECSVCCWRYSGLTGKWLSPSPLRCEELRLPHEAPRTEKDSE